MSKNKFLWVCSNPKCQTPQTEIMMLMTYKGQQYCVSCVNYFRKQDYDAAQLKLAQQKAEKASLLAKEHPILTTTPNIKQIPTMTSKKQTINAKNKTKVKRIG